MTRSWLWVDGRFVAADSIPLVDRGLRYGMSVFESLLVRDGTAHFLRAHLDRLATACVGCEFEVTLPSITHFEELLCGVETSGLARVYVTAGEGGVTDSLDRCRVFVFVEEREPIQASVSHQGYDLGLSREKHWPLLGGLKTGNYWANVLAFRAGVARQKNETLLLNDAGELISGCMANVFLARGGEILTPPVSSGARDGVVREWVLAQRNVRQCGLTADDAQNADEIFLTSSWLGIMPAASIEGARLRSTEIAEELLQKYRALIAPTARPASK